MVFTLYDVPVNLCFTEFHLSGSINCLIDISERLPFTVTRTQIGALPLELVLEDFK